MFLPAHFRLPASHDDRNSSAEQNLGFSEMLSTEQSKAKGSPHHPGALSDHVGSSLAFAVTGRSASSHITILVVSASFSDVELLPGLATLSGVSCGHSPHGHSDRLQSDPDHSSWVCSLGQVS